MCKKLLCKICKKSLSYTIFSALWLAVAKYWFKRSFKVALIMQTDRCPKIILGGASSSWHNVHTHHLTGVTHESQSLRQNCKTVYMKNALNYIGFAFEKSPVFLSHDIFTFLIFLWTFRVNYREFLEILCSTLAHLTH